MNAVSTPKSESIYLQPSREFARQLQVSFQEEYVWVHINGAEFQMFGQVHAAFSNTQLMDLTLVNSGRPLFSLWVGTSTVGLSESEFNTLKPEFERRGIRVEVGK